MSNIWSKEIQSTEMLYYSRISRFNENNQREWFDMLGIKNGDKVLEVGCGGGHFCNMIKKYYPNCEVYGIDNDEEHINFAKQKSKELGVNINYQIVDIKELPFEDNYFDVVYSYTVIEHIAFNDFIKEQYRVLKPNGKIVVMGVATYENTYSHEFNYLADEIKIILNKLKFNKSIQVGKHVAFPEEIMINLTKYGFIDCNYMAKKIVYYNPDCQNDIIISQKQIHDEHVSNKANNKFLLEKAKNGSKYTQQLLELNDQRYKKRLELLKNKVKVFDFQITNVFTICAQKCNSIIK